MAWIRFEKATRLIRHLSIPAFTVPPSADEQDIAIPENSVFPKYLLPAPVHELRVKADLSGVEADPSLKPPPPPDVRGFLLALRTNVPRARLSAIVQAYPLIITLLRERQWVEFKADLDDAKTTGIVTSVEYDKVMQLVGDNNIPTQ